MKMIERWFPCAEVSAASASGWGTGNSEKALFTWFAARPLAQARAAVVTSLLPWPDDPEEQRRLQQLVRDSLTGYNARHAELVTELEKHYPDGASLLDPFSGRAMIPLEAARLGVRAWGIDYSPVATLGGQLLADYPLRDWSREPDLPFEGYAWDRLSDRLVYDVRFVLDEVCRRYEAAMAEFYPKHNGKQPWGYLWAMTLPCQNCGRRFPLTGSLLLRRPRKGDHGQSYRIDADRAMGTFSIAVHEGLPQGQPTRVVAQGKSKYDSAGKVAVCPFCEHVHPKEVHTRLAASGLGEDALLIAADLDPNVGKLFRLPTGDERQAAMAAAEALQEEPPFGPRLPAVPNEPIPPGNTRDVKPINYGAKTYGDLCVDRQTLGFVRLCRIISDLGRRLLKAGCSSDYAAALCGYPASVAVRKLKYSTRGATLQVMRDGNAKIDHIFGSTEAGIAFSYDLFEAGLGDGPGTWPSLTQDTIRVLRNQASRAPGRSAAIRRGSAVSLPMRDHSFDTVTTDPPYDCMINYLDVSDLFYVWIKRALSTSDPQIMVTADPHGLQEKTEEVIVSRGTAEDDHRTREHYDALLARALAEARRVLRPDGVVTIVFGHGEPEVWHRLLTAIGKAGFFLTGSWPAKTEKGGMAGSANIVTTLTVACRPAPASRPAGRASDVLSEVQREVKRRVPLWEQTGLALTDQLMASAGPAMEVVGRCTEVLDRKGDPVEPIKFLVAARRAVQEAADIRIERLPLETFDARTRFALFWSRVYGRLVQAKSEARWHALSSDLSLDDLRGILTNVDSGARLAYAREARRPVDANSATIDVAFALAAAWSEGLDAAGELLAQSCRDGDDPHLWAALTYLSARLPEADPDRQAWTGLVRARGGLAAVARDAQMLWQRTDTNARLQLTLPLGGDED